MQSQAKEKYNAITSKRKVHVDMRDTGILIGTSNK